MCDFLKKKDINLKNVDLYASFSQKGGPLPEKSVPLGMIF